jgi:hypothetical protein
MIFKYFLNLQKAKSLNYNAFLIIISISLCQDISCSFVNKVLHYMRLLKLYRKFYNNCSKEQHVVDMQNSLHDYLKSINPLYKRVIIKTSLMPLWKIAVYKGGTTYLKIRFGGQLLHKISPGLYMKLFQKKVLLVGAGMLTVGTGTSLVFSDDDNKYPYDSIIPWFCK